MFYIATKFGFVSGFIQAEDFEGAACKKARHCLDPREALPFTTYQAADKAIKASRNGSWWYCILNTEHGHDTR